MTTDQSVFLHTAAASSGPVDPIAVLLRDKRNTVTRNRYADNFRHFFTHLEGMEGDPPPEVVLLPSWGGHPRRRAAARVH